MEALIFIALVIIIILLFNIKSQQKATESRTHQSFLSLKKELIVLQEKIKVNPNPPTDLPVKPTDENVIQWRPNVAPIIKEKIIVPVTPPPSIPVAEEEPVVASDIIASGLSPTAPREEPVYPQVRPTVTEGWWDKWLRNNPDLEKFIGENLVNKIGITVLVLGIAFFVKYAIDQNWIKEAGRVSIGIGCGALLIGVAHYLRNSYRSFSSVLAGGGIAVFYFTIAFAFHQYNMFSQTAAFIIMVVITIFAVALSLLYDKIELAVIAAIGGFITPFLVSTGSGNYIVLFSYLLVLNIGMLILAWFKKWHLVNVIALFFTLLIYGGWLVQNTALKNEFTEYKNSLWFATAFYILFLGMALIYNIRARLRFTAFDFSLLMLTTFSYYAAGMTNLHFWNEGAYQGLFTIAVGAINFCLAGYLYKTNKGDKNLLYLLIGLTLTFISLAAPVQLHGHTITLFWSAEFVLLYWLHQRSSIQIFKYSSFIIMVLMLVSLMMDWGKANRQDGYHLTIIYQSTQGFITNAIAIIAFSIYAILLRKEQNTLVYLAGIKNEIASTIMILAAAILLYLTCIFGINLYFYNYQYLDVPNAWHQLTTYLFTVILLWIITRYRLSVNVILRLLLIAGCVIMYLLSISYVNNLRNRVIKNEYAGIQLLVHWLGAAVLLYLVYQSIVILRNNKMVFVHTGNSLIWLINIVLITFFSIECMHAFVFLTSGVENTDTSLQQYLKAGLTIVWALCSFAIMWPGMKYKYKTLRIISLSLFLLALIKLFLFDIRNISEGGKIAAFIMLGVLLLVISFMYQKLKKIIIDDANR